MYGWQLNQFIKKVGPYNIDHGNAEQMLEYISKEPHTAHTSNKVPLILIGDKNYLLG